jgi:anti-sigma factor RsiW
MNPDAEHLDAKEATEARLCAYLEGELAPDERVEIERHLQANPQHRQLLIELAKTREWMRLVPHESAPTEIAEAFAAQIERSMLLDERRDTTTSAMNRLPQYALMAAILLLTLGLGGVIVVVLRSNGNDSLGTASQMPAPLNVPPINAPATLPTVITGSPSQLADRATTIGPPSAPLAAPPDRSAIANATASAAPGDLREAALSIVSRQDQFHQTLAGKQIDESAVDSKQADAVRSTLTASGLHIPTSRKTICLMVSTPAPAATAKQISGFFTRNQLVFDDNQTRVNKPLGANKPIEDLPQNSGPIIRREISGPQPIYEQPARQWDFGNNSAANNEVQSAVSHATTEPSGLPVQSLQPVKTQSWDFGTEQIYVGYGLTPLQLELLHGTLATGGIDQTVKRLELWKPVLTVVDTTGAGKNSIDAANMITKGQTLTVTVPQLVGPGIEKTNSVKVADDGTISLPMLDPLSAAGISTTQLQERIAARYREANLIPQATVKVTINATQLIPATLPTTQTIVAAAPASTQPSGTVTGIIAAAPVVPPTTQPASTQPLDDDKVDVVVYVQKT